MESINPAQPQHVPPLDPMDKFSPTAAQMSGQTAPTNPYDQVENIKVHGKSKAPLIILLSLLIVLFLLVGASAFLGLVAYGKVGINNKELEQKISFAIQSLPFTPKTPQYLIYKSFEAQSNLKSIYIDASIALKSSQAIPTIPSLGTDFDFKILGPIDFHDKEKPEAQINFKMSPQVDADFVAVNDKLFFKINDLPAVLKGIASGAGYSLDTIMAKWIYYDLKSLESEARTALDEDKDTRDQERIQKLKSAILNSNAIKKIVVTNEELDGKPVYQMTLEMTNEEYTNFVNEIAKAVDPESYTNQLAMGNSSSGSFNNLKITTSIDKSTMNTVKSTISFRLQTGDFNDVTSQVLGASTIANFPNVYAAAVDPKDEYMDVSVVVNGSRFNEDFDIKEPEGSIPLETIVEQYTKQAMQNYNSDSDAMDFDMDSSGFGSSASPPKKSAPVTQDDGSGISQY